MGRGGKNVYYLLVRVGSTDTKKVSMNAKLFSFYLSIRAVGAGLAGLVEAPLSAGLVQPGAVQVLGGAPELDHAVVVRLSAGTHVLDRGKVGQAGSGGADGLVGQQHTDARDVAVRRGASGVVGLHRQVHHTVAGKLLLVLGVLEGARFADVEGGLQGAAALGGLQLLADVLVSGHDGVQTGLGATDVLVSHGLRDDIVVAGHVHGSLQRRRTRHRGIDQMRETQAGQSREHARVGSTPGDPSSVSGQVELLGNKGVESSDVAEGLLSVQPLKVLSGIVIERSRRTVVTVLQGKHNGTVLGGKLHHVIAVSRGSQDGSIHRRALATNAEEHNGRLTSSSPLSLVDEVSLLESAVDGTVVVVQLLNEKALILVSTVVVAGVIVDHLSLEPVRDTLHHGTQEGGQNSKSQSSHDNLL